MSIEPDTKDWTWVLDRPCPECGFDAATTDLGRLPKVLDDSAAGFAEALGRTHASRRPTPDVWSVLEYGCHVRDVHRVFDGRVQLMLTEDDPLFTNWDQDATALEGRYAEQDPAVVADELVAAAAAVGERYASVPDEAWSRTGRRSNGSVFTVDTLARYHLHDVVHHVHDIGTSG